MKKGFLIPLLCVLSLGAMRSAEKPTYVLTAICTPDPREREHDSTGIVSGDDALRESIGATRLIYASDGAPLRSILNARNRLQLKTPVLVYMGGFTTNNDDVIALEKSYRTGIAMTPVASLAGALDVSATDFTAAAPVDGELAIKASTATMSDVKDSKLFCFWVRIDDELMRVTAVSSAGNVKVERGFDGSVKSAHAAGARILSPVYVGNRSQLGAARHSNSWPAGPDYLRYAVDPGQPAAAKFKGNLVVGVMKTGYDGAWFDTFQPVPYNLCDALGRKVSYFWDFGGQKTYTFESYLDAIKGYVHHVRDTVRSGVGHEPILFANSATASYARGVKKLFNHGDEKSLLDGYCFEDSYLKVEARREKGLSMAAQADFVPITEEKWLFNVTNHADAARSGLDGFCMAGPAGYLAAYINPSQANYDQLLRYAYGSHLLTVTKERTTSFGLPLLVTQSGGVLPWPKLLFVPLGDPVDANVIPSLKLKNSLCYGRKFEHGFVVVNPSADKTSTDIPIPSGYVNALTQQPVTSLSLGPADAVVLIAASSP